MKKNIKKIKRAILRNHLVITGLNYLNKFKKSEHTIYIDKINKLISAHYFFNINTLIETGTYLGTTVSILKKYFDKIYSIELNEELALEAKKHFQRYRNIEIVQGDSANVINDILVKDSTKKLFWLDAHYSGGITAISQEFGHTPISKELKEILSSWIEGSVILIDDCCLFDGTNNYPKLLDLFSYVHSIKPALNIYVDKDIIHIY